MIDFGNIFRTVLLENPAAIEKLPAAEAAHMDRLLEGQRLEPLVFDRLVKAGPKDSKTSVSPERLTAWKTANLMAFERSKAFREVLDEVTELVGERASPAQLLPATQLAFFHYKSPELRPLVDLEIRLPGEAARELHEALKTQNFRLADDLVAADSQLPLLERDGVTIRVHRNTQPTLTSKNPEQEDAGTSPLLQSAEALVHELCREIFARRFSHSLLLLHDLDLVFTSLKPSTEAILGSLAGPTTALETFLTLGVLTKVLGTALDPELLRQLEKSMRLSASRTKTLCDLCTTAALEYPASQTTRDLIEKQIVEITSPKALFA